MAANGQFCKGTILFHFFKKEKKIVCGYIYMCEMSNEVFKSVKIPY